MIEKYNSAYDENHSKLTYILRYIVLVIIGMSMTGTR